MPATPRSLPAPKENVSSSFDGVSLVKSALADGSGSLSEENSLDAREEILNQDSNATVETEAIGAEKEGGASNSNNKNIALAIFGFPMPSWPIFLLIIIIFLVILAIIRRRRSSKKND